MEGDLKFTCCLVVLVGPDLLYYLPLLTELGKAVFIKEHMRGQAPCT